MGVNRRLRHAPVVLQPEALPSAAHAAEADLPRNRSHDGVRPRRHRAVARGVPQSGHARGRQRGHLDPHRVPEGSRLPALPAYRGDHRSTRVQGQDRWPARLREDGLHVQPGQLAEALRRLSGQGRLPLGRRDEQHPSQEVPVRRHPRDCGVVQVPPAPHRRAEGLLLRSGHSGTHC